MSIKQLLTLATLSIAALLVISAAFSLWVFSSTEAQLARALVSYEQLSIATGLETDAARALLAQTQRRQGMEAPAPLLVKRRDVDVSIESLIARIRDEIGGLEDPNEQATEAEEFVAAFAIRESYARLWRGLEEAPRASGPPLDQQALAFFLDLDGQLDAVVGDERAEVGAALERLEALRSRLRSYALGATLAAVLAIVAAAIFSYQALMRPLRALDAGSSELASGNIAHRIKTQGPPELSQLAERLNHMAARLESQRSALRESNERLEQTVAERTAELADKAERLQRIDASRRLFFAKVGHELRTPLTVLLGETEVALGHQEATADAYRDALEHIGASGELLKRRIADLMAVARSDDGRLQVTREATDLVAVTRSAVDATKSYARSNGVALVLKEGSEELQAHADADWLRQALMALIDNAIKFSPPDGDVSLGVAVESGEGVIEILDRGAGVSQEELPLLAQPYFQGENVSGRAGTGLGLAVAHWVVEQHQGHMSFANRSGGGLRVALHLPTAAS